MRVTDAIAQQIKASGGASCNKREFALLAADLLDARNRITELEAQLAEARKDGERLREILFAYGEANEATQHPYWLVLRNGVLRACDAVLAGPFFSREAATNHMMARRYEYGDKAYVYCFSGHRSRQYKDLRDAAIDAARQKERK